MVEDLRGTWFVVPTAFKDDGSLDLEGQRSVVDAAVDWGVDGLTVMGVMSEAPSLTDEERAASLGAIFEAVANRVPVAVGCSAASVAQVVSYAHAAARLGAVAAMVSAPPLTKNVDALPSFYERVAKESGLPIVVQDEPEATGTVIPVSVLLRCLESCGCKTVKLEDPPTPTKISRLLAARSDLNVFGGLGGIAALGELRRGGCGTMTGFSCPEVLAAVRIEVEAGRLDSAAEMFDRYLPLIAFEAQPKIGLGIRKEMLVRRGALPSHVTRSLAPLDKETIDELDHTLERMGLEPSRARMDP
jgi:4-hydroxy-tetrahydrodipicolinate synthase